MLINPSLEQVAVEIQDLRARLEKLSPMGVRFVARLVDSLLSPPHAEFMGATWIANSPEWIEYFGLTISAHHGLTVEPLMLTSFEVAFRNACEAVDWSVNERASATERFVDLTVTTESAVRKLSLKSTAQRRLSSTTVHISKLTEAAWIQDVRAAKARRDKTLELFTQYREAVDAIIMLRAFRKEANKVPTKYQLLEIPTAIFDSLSDAPVAAFAADGPTIDCPYRGEPIAARVSLDRSDAKITVKQIKLSSCVIHAEWHMVTKGILPPS